MKWWMFLVILLAAGCLASEGEERLPSPTATSTQIMDLTGAVVEQDAEGKLVIYDQGDGCEYHETGRVPARQIGDVSFPEEALLWATPPVPPQCVAGWSYEPDTGEIRIVVP